MVVLRIEVSGIEEAAPTAVGKLSDTSFHVVNTRLSNLRSWSLLFPTNTDFDMGRKYRYGTSSTQFTSIQPEYAFFFWTHGELGSRLSTAGDLNGLRVQWFLTECNRSLQMAEIHTVSEL